MGIEKGEGVPRSIDLVRSLKHISSAIDDVIIFTFYLLIIY